MTYPHDGLYLSEDMLTTQYIGVKRGRRTYLKETWEEALASIPHSVKANDYSSVDDTLLVPIEML